MRSGWPRRSLSAALLLSLMGCQGWPNFDYAPPGDVFVDEREVSGNVAQNLGTLIARTIISGSIDSTGISTTGAADQFSYEGDWYTGDVDYYAFEVREPSDVDIELEWPASNTTIDSFMYRYDPETRGLTELLDASVDPQGTRTQLFVGDLEGETLYILIVGGRSGPSSIYDLTIAPTPLEVL